MSKSSNLITVEQTFNAAIDVVWNALTNVDLMRQWYFENIPAFEPVSGFETKFNVHSNGRDFLHIWKITEVLPNKKITYEWKYAGY